MNWFMGYGGVCDDIYMSKDIVRLNLWRFFVNLTLKKIIFLNFNLSCSLNYLFENLMECKNLECFDLFKS
jgi:hypothetical protein